MKTPHSIAISAEPIPAAEILAALPARISDVLAAHVARAPHHPALVEGGVVWSYQQLAERVAEAKIWLADSGIRPGDRLMIVGENSRALIVFMLAAAALDAWPVLVNARLSASEVAAIRAHCGARRLLYTVATSSHSREHARRDAATLIQHKHLGEIALGPLDEQSTPEPLESSVADRVGALIYTSGTTGEPKGVMLTHRGLLFVAAISARIRSLTPADRLYGVLPITHAVGLSVVLLGSLLSGATLYLAPRFDPVAALAALKNDGLTILLGVPAMFSLLVEYCAVKGLRRLQFPKLRIISSSGAPLHAQLKSDVEALFGLVLHNGYGVTECSPTIAQTRVESPRADTSIGQAFPGTDLALLSADGTPVGEGEVGELFVRGPNVMKGYYRAPQATAEVINFKGWFSTRDLARRTPDGNYFIVGRAKELIVHFGFNVYPAELEAMFNSHPQVTRSAVIGRKVNGSAGDEEIIAFIQPKSEAGITVEQLAEHAAQRLAPYKRPSRIVLVRDMPLTPTGKVAKEDLARMALPPN